MKILFRPHRSTLEESMKELVEFSSLIDMFEYCSDIHDGAFNSHEVYIHYYRFDHRISWHTYVVCVTRYFENDYIIEYGVPQAIGFCNIVE